MGAMFSNETFFTKILYRRKITILKKERMNCIWHYALLDDAIFTSLSQNNASLMEILRYSELTQNKVKEGLFE